MPIPSSSAPAMSPPAPLPIRQDTKTRLLSGATHWLLNHGAEAFSLRLVARDLNTSARMLVYHFGSKTGLLEAVLAEIARRWMLGVQQFEAAGLARQLRVLWSDQLMRPDAQKLHVLTLQLWATGLTSRDPAYSPFVKTLSKGWIEVLARHFLTHGHGAEDARARAMLCVAAIEGLLLHHMSDDALPADAAFRHLMDVVEGWLQS